MSVRRAADAVRDKALDGMQGSIDQFRMMIDNIPALAWSCRPDGATEFLNQRWLDYTGELQNVVERAVILFEGKTFAVDQTWLSHESARQSLPKPLESKIATLGINKYRFKSA